MRDDEGQWHGKKLSLFKFKHVFSTNWDTKGNLGSCSSLPSYVSIEHGLTYFPPYPFEALFTWHQFAQWQNLRPTCLGLCRGLCYTPTLLKPNMDPQKRKAFPFNYGDVWCPAVGFQECSVFCLLRITLLQFHSWNPWVPRDCVAHVVEFSW